MSLLSALRPRVVVTTGAALLLAVPLAIVALGVTALAAVAVRRDRAVRDLLVQGAENLKQGAKIAEATGERIAAIDEMLGSLANIKGMVGSASRVLARAEERASAGGPPASDPPAHPDALDRLAANGAPST